MKRLIRLCGFGLEMERESNIPMSDPMIQEEAKIMAETMKIEGFSESNGWLEKWKIQHNIRQFNVAGEDVANNNTVKSWLEHLPEITKGYEFIISSSSYTFYVHFPC